MRGHRVFLADPTAANNYGWANGYHYVIAERLADGDLLAYRFFKHYKELHSNARQLFRQGNVAVVCLTGKRSVGGVTDDELTSDSSVEHEEEFQGGDDERAASRANKSGAVAAWCEKAAEEGANRGLKRKRTQEEKESWAPIESERAPAEIHSQPKALVEDEEDEAARGRLARATGETRQSVLDKLLRSETLKKSFGGVFSRNKERGEAEGFQVIMSDFTGRLSSAEVKALDFMEALPEPEGLLLAATCMRLAQEEPMATNLAKLLSVQQQQAASAVVVVSPRKKAAPKGHQVAVLEAAILAVPPCLLALEGDLTIDVMSLLKIQPSALLDNSKFRADSIEAGNVRAILNCYGRWVIETRKLAVSKPNVVTTGVAVLFDERTESEARYVSRTVAPTAEAFATDGELAAAVFVEFCAEQADAFGDEVEKSPKTVKTGHNVAMGRMLMRGVCVYRSASLRYYDLRMASFDNAREAAFLLWSSSRLLNAIPSAKGEANALAVARRSAYSVKLDERYERKKEERKKLLAGNVYTRECDPLRHQSAEELATVLDFIDNVVGTGDVKKLRRLGLMARRLRGVTGYPFTVDTPLSGRVRHPGLSRDIPGRLGMTSYEALTYFYRNEAEVIAGDSSLVLLSPSAANSYPVEEERMEMARNMLDESASQPQISSGVKKLSKPRKLGKLGSQEVGGGT